MKQLNRAHLIYSVNDAVRHQSLKIIFMGLKSLDRSEKYSLHSDAIACIESEKSDITCNDTYIVCFLHFSARHNKFIDNNENLPHFITRV